MTARFATPAAFRQSLEDRLRRGAGAAELNHKRQLLVTQRLLARLDVARDFRVVLKGGIAMVLRIERARATRDVDLCWFGDVSLLLDTLRSVLRTPTTDEDDAWFSFEVMADPRTPKIRTPALSYGGRRFRAQCTIGGMRYGDPFGVDIAIADPFLGRPDRLRWPTHLLVDGLAAPEVDVLPIAAHVAEKLHAYTQPRPGPNSRVRDLPDLALLATLEGISSRELREAIEVTFNGRGTHPVPEALPSPPAGWEREADKIAAELGMPRPALASFHAAAAAMLGPVLAGTVGARRWDPAEMIWRFPE